MVVVTPADAPKSRDIPLEMHSILTGSPLPSAGTAVWLTWPDADFMKGRYMGAKRDIPSLQQRKQQTQDKDLSR